MHLVLGIVLDDVAGSPLSILQELNYFAEGNRLHLVSV
jgi:hypothetical protein